MKAFCLIFLLLPLLQKETTAQSISLSFVDLLSHILDHGRSAHEILLNSNLLFNSTSPSFNFDLQLHENSSNCSRDIQRFTRDLIARQLWALKTFDAWGKLPSGLMHGNIYWIGSVYECQHHLRGFNNVDIAQPFKTRTCTIGNGISTTIRPVYGLCLPESCNASDILNLINQNIIHIPFAKNLIHLTNNSIHCIEYRRLDSTAIVTIVLFFSIFFLILFATAMYINTSHKQDLKTDDTPATTPSEPLLSRTTTSSINRPRSTNETNELEQSISSNEATPLITRSRQPVDSVAQNLISCCSLINNYHILKANSYPRNLACLNGIRVLSLCWIILGHTILFAAYYSDNALTIFNWSRKLWFQIIIQTFFSIESFFLLSGLLTSFTYFIVKNENEQFSVGKFLLNHYVYHYLRYTPLYAFILLVYITLSPYLGQGGPMYPCDGIESPSCRLNWWRNLLYINNFFSIRDSCMPVTWFLALNMQFHWIAPLFLLVVSWKWILGMLVSLLFIVVDIVATSVIVSKNNYDSGFLSDFHLNKSNWTSMANGYFNDVYTKPWCRLAPYAFGLAIGYILYEVYHRSNVSSWDSLIPRARIYNRYYYTKQIFVWLIALVLLALCIFGTYGDYSGKSLRRADRIAFLTLSRLGWAVGLSMVIVTCFAGYGGMINRFLSRASFYKLSKLTYGAYLWHTLVIFVNYLGREQPTHYTAANILFNFVSYTIISYALSFVTFLLLELPILQLLKYSFKRPSKF